MEKEEIDHIKLVAGFEDAVWRKLFAGLALAGYNSSDNFPQANNSAIRADLAVKDADALMKKLGMETPNEQNHN